MTNPFIDLAPQGKEKNPFADLSKTQVRLPTGEVIGELPRSAEVSLPPYQNFEEFIHDLLSPAKIWEKSGQTAIRGTGLLEGTKPGRIIRAGGVGLAMLPQLPAVMLESLVLVPYMGIKEILTESSIVKDALSSVAALIPDPLKRNEALVSISEKYSQRSMQEAFGKMDPDEAESARRAFFALILSLPAAEVGAFTAGSLFRGATSAGLTKSGLTAGQIVANRSRAALASGIGGAQAGATTFAAAASTSPEDFAENLAFYSVQLAPFGLAYWMGRKIYGRGQYDPTIEPTKAGAEAARQRAVRIYDDQPALETQEAPPSSEARVRSDDFSNGAVPEIGRNRIIADNLELNLAKPAPERIAELEREFPELKGKSRAELEAIARGETEAPKIAGIDEVTTILKTHASLTEREVAIIPGLGSPIAKSISETPLASLSDAKTGQSFSGILLRGEGRSTSPYSEFVPQEPIVGPGRYTTPDLEYAESFGPNVTKHRVELKNPLVITNKAGWKYPNPFGSKDLSRVSQEIRQLRQNLEQEGYDGLIVRMNQVGDYAKILRNVFGEDQVVEFNPSGAETSPAANIVNAVQLAKSLNSEALVAVHERPDGLFDLAVGRRGSKLYGAVAQFENQGFYKGQSVIVDGKHYIYQTGAGKETAIVFMPGEEKPLLVPFDRVRRAPWNAEIRVEPLNMAELQKELPAEEFKLVQELLDESYAPGRPLKLATPEESLASNGFMIQKNVTGGFTVRDKLTGRRIAEDFKTEKDAMDFVNQSGQGHGPDFTPPVEDTPYGGIENLGPPEPPDYPPGGMAESFNLPQPGFEGVANLYTRFNASKWGSFLTKMKQHFLSVDNIYGTYIHNKFFVPTQNAALAADHVTGVYCTSKMDPLLQRMKRIYKGETNKKLELMGRYQEQMSYQEMVTEGIAKNRLPTSLEIDLGHKIARAGVDTRKVLDFRAAIREALKMEAARVGRIQRKNVTVEELPPQVVARIEGEVINRIGLTPDEIKAAQIFEQISKLPMDEASIVSVVMLAEAEMNPAAAMSKAEFAKLHGLTKQDIGFVQEMGKLFDEAAAEFGIEDYKLLRYYLRHVNKFGTQMSPEAAFLGQRAGTFSKIRDFASNYSRTGEVDTYDTNMFRNLFEYIRAGNRDLYFKPIFNEALESIRVDLINRNIPKDHLIMKSLDEYSNVIRGIPDELGPFSQLVEGFLKKMGISSVNEATKLWMMTTNAGFMGLRPGLGARDFYDFNNKFFTRLGLDRFRRMYRFLNLKTIEQLKSEGKIGGLTMIDFLSQGEFNANARQGIKKAIEKASPVGLQVSLQPLVYEMAQAGAYMDMFTTIPRILNKLPSEILTRDITLPHRKPNPRFTKINPSLS